MPTFCPLSQIEFPLNDVNPYIVCRLCAGYLIGATTITECLHTCTLAWRARQGAPCLRLPSHCALPRAPSTSLQILHRQVLSNLQTLPHMRHYGARDQPHGDAEVHAQPSCRCPDVPRDARLMRPAALPTAGKTGRCSRLFSSLCRTCKKKRSGDAGNFTSAKRTRSRPPVRGLAVV